MLLLKTAVVVPWRDTPDRRPLYDWVRARWAGLCRDMPVVEGRCDDGPWCKADAIADALSRTDADVLVVSDADVWCDQVMQAVRAVGAGASWAVPHLLVHRLGPAATGAVLAGGKPTALTVAAGLVQQPYRGVEAGGLLVIRRDLLERIPPDARFRGWGQEDLSWGLALRTLAGKPWRGTGPLWHLWHQPPQRLNRHVGSRESQALWVRYQQAGSQAARYGTQAMQALIDEAKGAWCDSASVGA